MVRPRCVCGHAQGAHRDGEGHCIYHRGAPGAETRLGGPCECLVFSPQENDYQEGLLACVYLRDEDIEVTGFHNGSQIAKFCAPRSADMQDVRTTSQH